MRHARNITLLALAAVAAGALGGCRGERTAERPRQFFPGMDDQPKYRPQSESEFFADGRSMREPIAGTVAFGARPDDRDDWAAPSRGRAEFLREDDRVYLGVDDAGEYVERAPIASLLGLPNGQAPTPEQVRDLIERGRDRFTIYCTPCHGGTGDGKGMVGAQWAYALPNFHDPKYLPGGELGRDGYIFHVIRNGLANAPGAEPALRMPAYGERIGPRDAWAVVLYLRALQETRRGEMADVPESLRRDLIRSRGAATGGGGE